MKKSNLPTCPFCIAPKGNKWDTIMSVYGDEYDEFGNRWIKAFCSRCMEYRYVDPFDSKKIVESLEFKGE